MGRMCVDIAGRRKRRDGVFAIYGNSFGTMKALIGIRLEKSHLHASHSLSGRVWVLRMNSVLNYPLLLNSRNVPSLLDCLALTAVINMYLHLQMSARICRNENTKDSEQQIKFLVYNLEQAARHADKSGKMILNNSSVAS